jgi:hypothetical protein
MGQFSMEIYAPTGSLLSGNLHTGTTKFGKVTFQNPRDISYSFTMLTADIHCGLVMDLDGRVLGAYPTS